MIIVDNKGMTRDLPNFFLPGGLSPAALRRLPAHRAARMILGPLLDALVANRQGAVDGREIEGLHDFRVAIRRTRVALGQLRGLFPAGELARFRGEFRWLGAATGPVRDLDVYLFHFVDYQVELPEAYRDALMPLRVLLEDRRQAARRELSKTLNSRRYRSLVKDWRSFLEASAECLPVPEQAMVPIIEVASRRIRRLFTRVLKDGWRIDEASPPADLHALRIRCKKLRYLLEFFSGLYSPPPVKRLIGELKLLQDNLGAIQDLSVQTGAISGFAEELATTGAAPARTLLAIGMLIENLERHRETARGEFAGRFAHFSRERTRNLCRSLFAGSGKGDPGE